MHQYILTAAASILIISATAHADEVDSLGTIPTMIESSDVETLAEQMKQLRGEVEKMQHEVSTLKDQLNRFSADTNLRLKDMGGKSHSKEPGVDEFDRAEAAGTGQISDPEEQYQASYKLLKEKKYALAAKGFHSFLKHHPDHAQAGSACYWLGEIKMMDKQYDQAAVEYMRGYKKDPKGNRAPENLLKLGTSLGKINKRREACISLFKLQKEFPNPSANIKKHLDEQLKLLSCG